MYTESIFMLFGSLIGCGVMIVVWFLSDRRREKQYRQWREYQIYNPQSFCYDHCKYSDKCYGEIKDPDQAESILVNEYCIKCPVGVAQDLIEEAERKDKR